MPKPSSPDRTGENDVLISYANTKNSELDARKRNLAKRLANLVDDGVSPDRMLRIPEFPDDWGEAGMDGKRAAGEKGDRGRKIGRARSPSTQWMDFMPLCWGG